MPRKIQKNAYVKRILRFFSPVAQQFHRHFNDNKTNDILSIKLMN